MATLEMTGDNFEQTVTDNDIVLLDFWAAWCGPCRMFGPIFEAASEAEQNLAGAAGINSIPTLMAFREGVLVFSQPGALPAAALEQVIAGIRGLDMAEVHHQVAEMTATRQEA
jgi:thioredoxin 1